MFRIVKMFSDLHYFIVAEYILFLHLYRNLYQKSIHLLTQIPGIPLFYQEKSSRKGNCKYSFDKWSYYLYKKRVFCTERHSLRYEGLVVKFVQFYKDPGEMHTCRNKSIRLWTCIFLPTNVSTSPLLTLLNHTSSLPFPLTPTPSYPNYPPKQ